MLASHLWTVVVVHKCVKLFLKQQILFSVIFDQLDCLGIHISFDDILAGACGVFHEGCYNQAQA